MFIYNHLFFHAHSLGLKSREISDMPYFLSLGMVSLCFMFNIFAISFILEAFNIFPFIFKKEYKWFFPILFLGIIFGYYLYNNRYKFVYEKWRNREGEPTIWKSRIIVGLYIVFSLLMAMLAAMYKNGDGIFNLL